MTTKSRSVRNVPVSRAIDDGVEEARSIVVARTKQLRRRIRLAAKLRVERADRSGQQELHILPKESMRLTTQSVSAGALIAEGDSWFDYPFHDVLKILEDDYLYDVESVAHKGDCIEDMAHSRGQFEDFARRLEKLLRAGRVPKAILLSGGGNDISGDEFALLLNHASSSLAPLNEDIVRGVIDVRLRNAYARIISGITEIAKSYLGRPIAIVIHGYDYALPDGRGFAGGFWILPGPWLEPGFRRKGHSDFAKNAQVIVQLMDRFNQMLQSVSEIPHFAHVSYLDLRKTLDSNASSASYKKDWANELHPSGEGFRKIARKVASRIESL